MSHRSKCMLISGGLSLSFASSAGAHGFARYVSTPISPPAGFEWVRWAYIAIVITLGSFLVWRVTKDRLTTVTGFVITVLSFGSLTLWMLGRFWSSQSTAPPPGLGPPSTPFWGFGWSESGIIFIVWNLLGLGAIVCFVILAKKLFRGRIGEASRVRLAAPLLGCYLLGVVPYVATGALSHGWAGSYANRGCERNIKAIYDALDEYVANHDGRLPAASNFSEVFEQLDPYFEEPRTYYGMPADICPIGGAYKKEPKTYEWDSSFNGLSIKEAAIRMMDLNEFPINCPYHESIGRLSILRSRLRKRIAPSIKLEVPH